MIKFPYVILLPFELLFPKRCNCQFLKSDQIYTMIFKEKFKIKDPKYDLQDYVYDYDWEVFWKLYFLQECIEYKETPDLYLKF